MPQIFLVSVNFTVSFCVFIIKQKVELTNLGGLCYFYSFVLYFLIKQELDTSDSGSLGSGDEDTMDETDLLLQDFVNAGPDSD